ncbi:DUF6629 family protein [Aeromicrobium stalagmiti]|uniref:DUF6629 family protein n=1 Tax=Aeromicrobium stalagmiti TaxID=2738988 RepID=UPI0015690394|nr:DUF6629 family protein [Aeromicrobium stalagmiti]NRQ51655.1 hypothetical protein [Aeromicrobium stalagmiti]
MKPMCVEPTPEIRFPVTAQAEQGSVLYESPHFYIAGVLAAYLMATRVSGLFSSHRCDKVSGILAFILAVVAACVSITTFVSVWCFYAAILSLLIYLHFSGPMQACRETLASRTAPDLSVTSAGPLGSGTA